MNQRIVIATSNRGKFLEMEATLQSLNIPLLSLPEFPQVPEAPETGNTFEEIARNKATFYYERIRVPLIAEDSGLVVPDLGGFPGILSARIAETDEERIRIILEKLQNARDRSAFYHCSMIFISQEGIVETTGRCYGRIAERPRGTVGFGYDPVFFPENTNRTFGEMSLEEKANHSHRGIALRGLLPHLKGWIRNNS